MERRSGLRLFLEPFALLFLTIVIGSVTARIRIRGVALGPAMLLFTGILISCLVGRYADSLTAADALYETARKLVADSIVPSSVQNLFMIFFMSAVGLAGGRELVPILRKYGIRFLGLAVLVTTFGMLGTYAMGVATRSYNPYELSGVFSGALSSTPGVTAALSAAADRSVAEIASYRDLPERKKAGIRSVAGEPDADGEFSADQRAEYLRRVQTYVAIGYTVTFPFGNLLVLIAINLIPLLFRIDIEREKTLYEAELRRIVGPAASESPAENDRRGAAGVGVSYFFVLLVGQLLGGVRFGSFTLSGTGGVLLAALFFGALRKLPGMSFRFGHGFLKTIRDVGVSGVLSCIGLRLGYVALQAITGTQVLLALWAIAIGGSAMMLGFFAGRYVFRLNWMILSGALSGATTNTSGLGVAIDATGSDHPSIGYAATYPFAVIMKVMYSVLIQGFAL